MPNLFLIFLISKMGKIPALAIYCYITNTPTETLKQETCIILQILWAGNLGMPHLGASDSGSLAAAANSLQPCPTLCDPIDGSLTGSSSPGILQAGRLDWVAISFSNAGK